MQPLLRSKQPIFCVLFRDYIRAKYREELILREETDERQNAVTALYLPSDLACAAQIMQELQIFIQNPNHERYRQAGWQSGTSASSHHPYSAQNFVRSAGFHFNALLRHGKFTLFITALCALIYFLQLIGWEQPIMQAFHYPAYPEQEGQIWRYVTHSLVHLSLWHIAFNLLWWWIFADMIERKFGSGKLILLYLLSAVISGVAQNLASGPAFFGLSGVVYAVLGFVFGVDRFGKSEPFNLPQGFFNMLLVGIGFGFISPLIDIQMGNSAHISGLIVGLAYGFLQAKSTQRT